MVARNTLAVAASIAISGSVSAQVLYTFQEREVSAAVGFFPSGEDFQERIAPDFGPFSQEARVGSEQLTYDVRSKQSSMLLDDRMFFSGEFSVRRSDGIFIAGAAAGYVFDVRFTVTQTQLSMLHFNTFAPSSSSAGPASRLRFSGPGFMVETTESLDQQRLLFPGDYRLTVLAGAQDTVGETFSFDGFLEIPTPASSGVLALGVALAARRRRA